MTTTKPTTYHAYELADHPELLAKVCDNYRTLNVDYDWVNESPRLPSFLSCESIEFDINEVRIDRIKVADMEQFRKFLRIPKQLWGAINCFFAVVPIDGHQPYLSLTHHKYQLQEVKGKNLAGFTPKQHQVVHRANKIWREYLHNLWFLLMEEDEYRISDEGILQTLIDRGICVDEDGKICDCVE